MRPTEKRNFTPTSFFTCSGLTHAQLSKVAGGLGKKGYDHYAASKPKKKKA